MQSLLCEIWRCFLQEMRTVHQRWSLFVDYSWMFPFWCVLLLLLAPCGGRAVCEEERLRQPLWFYGERLLGLNLKEWCLIEGYSLKYFNVIYDHLLMDFMAGFHYRTPCDLQRFTFIVFMTYPRRSEYIRQTSTRSTSCTETSAQEGNSHACHGSLC